MAILMMRVEFASTFEPHWTKLADEWLLPRVDSPMCFDELFAFEKFRAVATAEWLFSLRGEIGFV